MPPQHEDPRELGQLVGRELSTAIVLFHEAAGRRLGLSGTERKLLDVLARMGPSTAGQLAAHTRLTTGAITGIVDRLVRADYARRQPNPGDRRSVIVSRVPSTDLDQLRLEIFAPLGQAIIELSAHYSEAELEAISGYLRGLTEILRQQTEHLTHEMAASSS
jgi:DNA-binding MarR family transcriptional regulator